MLLVFDSAIDQHAFSAAAAVFQIPSRLLITKYSSPFSHNIQFSGLIGTTVSSRVGDVRGLTLWLWGEALWCLDWGPCFLHQFGLSIFQFLPSDRSNITNVSNSRPRSAGRC